MVAWLNKLPFAILCFQILFDRVGSLIICHIELGLESPLLHLREYIVESTNDACIRHTFDWYGKDHACVIVICNEKILIAVQRPRWQCSCGISVECATDLVSKCCKAEDIVRPIQGFFIWNDIRCGSDGIGMDSSLFYGMSALPLSLPSLALQWLWSGASKSLPWPLHSSLGRCR